MENQFELDNITESELLFDLARWTLDGAPTMDVAFTRNQLEPDEVAQLDAWLSDDPERHMKWERMKNEADTFKQQLRPLTMEALRRFEAATETSGISSEPVSPVSAQSGRNIEEFNALALLLGFKSPHLRSAVVLSAFPGEWNGSPSERARAGVPKSNGQGEILASKSKAGYRYAVALGDLLAAQNLQRMCIDQHIKAPKFTADQAEMRAWDRPQINVNERVESSVRHHDFPNVFVVGLVSNETFVRLYNERLRPVFRLRYKDEDAMNGLQASLPLVLPSPADGFTRKCICYSHDGVPLNGAAQLADPDEFFANFIVVARVTDDGETYFIVGGDCEQLTHFAGKFVKDRWPALLQSLSGLRSDDDFVKVFRVSNVRNYDSEKPALIPVISWIGQTPDGTLDVDSQPFPEPGRQIEGLNLHE